MSNFTEMLVDKIEEFSDDESAVGFILSLAADLEYKLMHDSNKNELTVISHISTCPNLIMRKRIEIMHSPDSSVTSQ